MATFLGAWLDKNGFTHRRDTVGNLYAFRSGAGSPLLLCTHMDTVEPGIGIQPVENGGVIKSSGDTVLGADNKAAVAAVMTAVEKSKGRSLELLFTVKEETGGGIEHFPADWIKAKKGLTFDSANPLGGIVLRSPFIANFKIAVTGKAAHASTPGEGINAFIPAFAAFPAIPLGELDNGETTVNIGKILGGTGINTVPGTIEIQGEVRSYEKEYFEARMANIKSIFLQAASGAHVKCDFTTDGYCPGYSHGKEDAMVTQIAGLYAQLGLETVYYPYSGVSDANILNSFGIDTVNLTDGTKFPHTVNEEMAVQDLDTLHAIVLACINKL